MNLFLRSDHAQSNNDLEGFSLPCSGIDAVYYNDGDDDMSFVDDLRSVFATAGISFTFIGPQSAWWHQHRSGAVDKSSSTYFKIDSHLTRRVHGETDLLCKLRETSESKFKA